MLQGSINTAENLSQQAIQTSNLNQAAIQQQQQQQQLKSQPQPQQQQQQQQQPEPQPQHHHPPSESVRFAPESDNEEKPVHYLNLTLLYVKEFFVKN